MTRHSLREERAVGVLLKNETARKDEQPWRIRSGSCQARAGTDPSNATSLSLEGNLLTSLKPPPDLASSSAYLAEGGSGQG
jgi:hypothetical protein